MLRPDVYLTNNPGSSDPTLRAFERASGTLNGDQSDFRSYGHDRASYGPILSSSMRCTCRPLTPLRTPSFTMFRQPRLFRYGGSSRLRHQQNPGDLLRHANSQALRGITATCCRRSPPPGWVWSAPGVDVAAEDNTTWSDHHRRPAHDASHSWALKDDYPHDGRALVEKFQRLGAAFRSQEQREFRRVSGRH